MVDRSGNRGQWYLELYENHSSIVHCGDSHILRADLRVCTGRDHDEVLRRPALDDDDRRATGRTRERPHLRHIDAASGEIGDQLDSGSIVADASDHCDAVDQAGCRGRLIRSFAPWAAGDTPPDYSLAPVGKPIDVDGGVEVETSDNRHRRAICPIGFLRTHGPTLGHGERGYAVNPGALTAVSHSMGFGDTAEGGGTMIDAGTALDLIGACAATSQSRKHRYPKVAGHPRAPVCQSIVAGALEFTELPPQTIEILDHLNGAESQLPDGLTLGAFLTLSAARRRERRGGSADEIFGAAINALNGYLDLVPFDALLPCIESVIAPNDPADRSRLLVEPQTMPSTSSCHDITKACSRHRS
jgi:hypothetical protein